MPLARQRISEAMVGLSARAGRNTTMFASRLSALAAALFLGLLGLCGCGGTATGGLGAALRPDATTGSGACVSGQQSACACPNSSNVGAQICNADGHSFGPCMG